MAEIDFFRRQATLATVRAQVAEDALETLRRQQPLMADVVAAGRAETDRLRALVDLQAAQLSELHERLRDASAERRQVPIESLVRSLLTGIDDGAKAMEERTVGAVHADI